MFQKRFSVADLIRSVILLCALVSAPLAGAGELAASLYRVTVPSAGLLAVDVAAPLAAGAAEPVLAYAGRGCAADRRPLVIDRSATHVVLAVEDPGDYLFAVAPQDPSAPLGDVRLRSGFSVAVPKDGEDEEILEIEADPLTAGGIFAKDGEDEEILEIEADPPRLPCGPTPKDGEDEEILEIEADPLVGVAGRSMAAMLGALCAATAADDHGDSFTCATFLAPNRRVAGEISNGWGDDGDVFEVLVGGPGSADPGSADLWNVEIAGGGEIETAIALYDRAGRRLETAGGGAGVRIVRALPAGPYFVRVEGRHGAEGRYTLSVAAKPW